MLHLRGHGFMKGIILKWNECFLAPRVVLLFVFFSCVFLVFLKTKDFASNRDFHQGAKGKRVSEWEGGGAHAEQKKHSRACCFFCVVCAA